MNPLYGSTLHMPPLEQYKMLDHTKIEKSEELAPVFCGFFAAPSVREALGAERTEAAGGGLRGSN